ncbi:hypothetical protein GF342_02085 [Candidatus Woesearchaeota archaeon]|nr:hypothetical protein [Candidatus Woesearchaeota archaeon]
MHYTFGGFMKRKVIQIANSTQLVSLPRSWALQHGVKKGQELNVDIQDSSLIISTASRESTPKTASIDVSGFHNRSMRIIGAFYRAGYDELKVYFNNYQELQFIQNVVREGCIGYELIDQGKNFVRIKKVSDAIDEEFDHVFRRLVMYIITMGRETYAAMQSHDKDQLRFVIDMDRGVNKFTDFCGRIITMTSKPGQHTLYHVVMEVEKIGDSFKHICQHLAATDLEVSKQLLTITKKVSLFVEHLHDLLFKFSKERITALYTLKNDIDESLDAYMATCTRQEAQIMFALRNIAESIDSIDMPLIITQALRGDLPDLMAKKKS